MNTIQDVEQEWETQPNTVALSTWTYREMLYTVSTVQLSQAPFSLFNQLITGLGDAMNNNHAETEKDYETMLFIDGESTGKASVALLPHFQDTPSNAMQGIFQRYDTREEAKQGHEAFVAQVKALLTENEQKGLL